MSVEVVNLFTSSNNINYLSEQLSKQINDTRIKEAVLDTLTESVFDFQSHAMVEDSGQRLRHSANTKTEIERLNKAFIDDRLAFAKNFNMYADAHEYYADQMFIDDSLRPGPYNHFNDCDHKSECECEKCLRLFRYQDKNDPNRSNIPVWQIASRGYTDYRNDDELRNSEVSQIRRASEAVTFDHIGTIPVECKRPQWIDI